MQLATMCNLSYEQVCNWFVNARMRMLRKEEKSPLPGAPSLLDTPVSLPAVIIPVDTPVVTIPLPDVSSQTPVSSNTTLPIISVNPTTPITHSTPLRSGALRSNQVFVIANDRYGTHSRDEKRHDERTPGPPEIALEKRLAPVSTNGSSSLSNAAAALQNITGIPSPSDEPKTLPPSTN